MLGAASRAYPSRHLAFGNDGKAEGDPLAHSSSIIGGSMSARMGTGKAGLRMLETRLPQWHNLGDVSFRMGQGEAFGIDGMRGPSGKCRGRLS
jgi:hypothetical protein